MNLTSILMEVIVDQEKEIDLLKHENTYYSLRLEKAGEEIAKLKESSRVNSYWKMARENFELAQRNHELEQQIKSRTMSVSIQI